MDLTTNAYAHDKLIGLIPAAGKATRLGNLPFSKELQPLLVKQGDNWLTKTTTEFLLEQIQAAGANKFHIILRSQKTDVLQYLSSGAAQGINIAYHITEDDRGVPFTINQAYPFIKDMTVLFGFPDILMQPQNVFRQLYDKFLTVNSDILLGLFPVDDYRKFDMVEIDHNQQVKNLYIKSELGKNLRMSWVIAVWKPSFSKYLYENAEHVYASRAGEIHLGDMIQEFIERGSKVQSLQFNSGYCIDTGTKKDLAHVVKKLAENPCWLSAK